MLITTHALSVNGRARSPNEDVFLVDASIGLYAVADGVSAGAAGEVAAALAIQTLRQVFKAWIERLDRTKLIADLAHEGLLRAAEAAAAAVYAEGREEPTRGMATSLTAACVSPQRAVVASVGDTRALLIRDGAARTLTRVDTLADELLRAGWISAEAAATHPYARALTRALGLNETTQFDTLAVDLEPGDVVALVTNGVDLSEATIAAASELSPRASASALASRLLATTGDDDATAVVIRREPLQELVFHAPPRPGHAASGSRART